MAQYNWAEIREGAAQAFGSYPDAELEQELIEVFRERPAFVANALENVVRGFKAGRIHSPWPFLRKQLSASAAAVAVVSDSGEQDRAVMHAKQWMRIAGLHFDRWSEVEQALFGPSELTAPLEQLERLEEATRGRPGRPMYDGLLRAAVARTSALGQQEIPDSGGPLSAWDSPELREELEALWEEVRTVGEEIEREQLVRLQSAKAKPRPKVKPESGIPF